MSSNPHIILWRTYMKTAISNLLLCFALASGCVVYDDQVRASDDCLSPNASAACATPNQNKLIVENSETMVPTCDTRRAQKSIPQSRSSRAESIQVAGSRFSAP